MKWYSWLIIGISSLILVLGGIRYCQLNEQPEPEQLSVIQEVVVRDTVYLTDTVTEIKVKYVTKVDKSAERKLQGEISNLKDELAITQNRLVMAQKDVNELANKYMEKVREAPKVVTQKEFLTDTVFVVPDDVIEVSYEKVRKKFPLAKRRYEVLSKGTLTETKVIIPERKKK